MTWLNEKAVVDQGIIRISWLSVVLKIHPAGIKSATFLLDHYVFQYAAGDQLSADDPL